MDFQVLVHNRPSIECRVAVRLPRHSKSAAGVVHGAPPKGLLVIAEFTVRFRLKIHVIELIENGCPGGVQQRQELAGALLPAGHGGEP